MNTTKERELLLSCLDIASECGAQNCRVTYSRNIEESVVILNGSVDKITRSEDRSLEFTLFVDGRYGVFSTNKTDTDDIRSFVKRAVEMVRALCPDKFRRLPDKERCCTEARDGNELGLFDESYFDYSTEDKIRFASALAVFGKQTPHKIVSEEGEYSDSASIFMIADSQGLDCRHIETGFDYGVEVTVEDDKGNKYSAYDWATSTRRGGLQAGGCGMTAMNKAAAQIGSDAISGGKYNMVVSNDISYKFVSPVINALNGNSIQQHNSFLEGSLGKAVFPEGLTVTEVPFIRGEGGSKLFDDEGIALKETDVIREGVVRQYYINTYMSGKLDMPGTSEDAARPFVAPWPKAELERRDILEMCGDGILVTDFNGGNINPATGDFSYGIEGFLFRNGKIEKPVSGMLVTGNILKLWSSLIAAGSDVRRGCVKLVPTLAFRDADFNGTI